MARKPTTKKTSTSGARDGLRERKKIEYNEHKLAVAASHAPREEEVIPKNKKKTPAPKKTGTTKGKKAAKGTSYLILVKRALKDVEKPGWGVESVVNFLEANYPEKTNRRFIRQALNAGVEKKLFAKHKASYRLTRETQEKMDRATPKKKTTKKATTKKAGDKKKKTATKKKSTTDKKKTTKKAGEKKKKTTTTKKSDKKEGEKKKTTKKAGEKKERKIGEKKKKTSEDTSTSPAKKSKKVIGPASDDIPTVTEAVGVWQYYDNGWYNYTGDASRIVEGVYQEFIAAGEGSGLDIRAIQSGHFSYMVNFQNMEQTNTSTGTMRKIRRS